MRRVRAFSRFLRRTPGLLFLRGRPCSSEWIADAPPIVRAYFLSESHPDLDDVVFSLLVVRKATHKNSAFGTSPSRNSSSAKL
jgi:hypothetical protein